MGPTFVREPFDAVVEWNVGHMVNTSPGWALGGELTVGSGNDDPLTGLRARARRWLTSDLSLELEGGIVRSNAADTQFPGIAGPTAALRLNARDQGFFYVRWDALSIPEESRPDIDHDPGGTHHGVSVGAAAGSWPGLIGTGTLGLVYAVLLGTYVSQAS